MANQASINPPSSSLTIKHHPEFLAGIDCAANLDTHGASDKLRRLIHQNPHLLPCIVTPLTRLCIQSDAPEKLQLLIAELFMMSGWYTEAIQELSDILDANPSHSMAYQLLSKIWSRAPQHTEIEALFENALTTGHFDSAILDVLPKMYLGKANLEKSIQLYHQLIQRDPSAIHLRLTLGNLYTKANRIDDAVATFEGILQESPLHAADVANRLDELISTSPDSEALRRALFKLHAKLCNLSQAGAHFETLLTQFPESVIDLIALLRDILPHYPNTPDVQLMLARAYAAAHEYSQAITALHQVAELGDLDQIKQVKTIALDILDRYPNQVYAMQLLVDIGISQKNGHDAIHHLRVLIQYVCQDDIWLNERFKLITEIAPNLSDDCRLLSALRFAHQKRFDQAIVEAQFLIGTSKSVDAQLLVANAYELKGDLVQSDATLRAALTTHPHHPDIHAQLVHLKERWLEGAIAHGSASPTATSPLQLGAYYLAQGAFYPAMTHLQHVLPGSDQYLNAQLLISRCFLELGRFDQALTHLGRMIETLHLDRETAINVRYLAGTNYFFQGDLDRCIDTLESILQFDITFANVNRLVQTLRSESTIPYRVKATSGIYHGKQLIVLSVKNPESTGNQPLSFAHPHNNAGVEYMFKHQYKTAEDEFKLALQMDPHLPVVYCNFTLLKLAQSQIDDAMELIASAKKVIKNHELLHGAMGLVLMHQNRWQDALREFEAAYTIRADNYATLINLGDCHYKLNHLEAATEFWNLAMAHHPVSHLIQRRVGYRVSLKTFQNIWETGGMHHPIE